MRFSDVNTEFVDKAGLEHTINELKAYIDGISSGSTEIPSTDLSNYYTKGEVYNKEETNALIPTVTNGVDGQNGVTPHIDSTTKHWMIGETDTGVVAEGQDGYTPVKGTDYFDGTNGTNGISPTVTVTKEGSIATITCTDVNGTTTAIISDGQDGSGGGSSGGTSGITYAYDTEIATGETWTDGKPIYMKVFHVDALASQPSNACSYSNYCTQDKFANEIISVIPRWKREDTGEIFTGNTIQTFAFSGSTASVIDSNIQSYILGRMLCCSAINNTDFHLYIGRGKNMYKYACDVFVKYTKAA